MRIFFIALLLLSCAFAQDKTIDSGSYVCTYPEGKAPSRDGIPDDKSYFITPTSPLKFTAEGFPTLEDNGGDRFVFFEKLISLEQESYRIPFDKYELFCRKVGSSNPSYPDSTCEECIETVEDDGEIITVDTGLGFLNQDFNIEQTKNGGLFSKEIPQWVRNFSQETKISLPKELNCEMPVVNSKDKDKVTEAAISVWNTIQDAVFKVHGVKRDSSLFLLPPSCGSSEVFPWEVPDDQKEADRTKRLACVFKTCKDAKASGKFTLKGYDFRNQLLYYSKALVAERDYEVTMRLLTEDNAKRPVATKREKQEAIQQLSKIQTAPPTTDWRKQFRQLGLQLSDLRVKLGLSILQLEDLDFEEFKALLDDTRKYMLMIQKNGDISDRTQVYVKMLGSTPINRTSAYILCQDFHHREAKLELEISFQPIKLLTYKTEAPSAMTAAGTPNTFKRYTWTAEAQKRLNIPGLSDEQMAQVRNQCYQLDNANICFQKMLQNPMIEDYEVGLFEKECSNVMANERFPVELSTSEVAGQVGNAFFTTPFKLSVEKFFENMRDKKKADPAFGTNLNECIEEEISANSGDIESLFLSDWSKNVRHHGTTIEEKKMDWLNTIANERGPMTGLGTSIPENFTYSLSFKSIQKVYRCMNVKAARIIRQKERDRALSGKTSCLWETPVACGAVYLSAMGPMGFSQVMLNDDMFAARLGMVNANTYVAGADATVTSFTAGFLGFFNPNGALSWLLSNAMAQTTKTYLGQQIVGNMMGTSSDMINNQQFWEQFRKNLYNTKQTGWQSNSPYLYCGNVKESCVLIKDLQMFSEVTGNVTAALIVMYATMGASTPVVESSLMTRMALSVGPKLFPRVFAASSAEGLAVTRAFFTEILENLPLRAQALTSALTRPTSGSANPLYDIMDKFYEVKVTRNESGDEVVEFGKMKPDGYYELTKTVWNATAPALVFFKLQKVFPNTSPKYLERFMNAALRRSAMAGMFMVPKIVDGSLDAKSITYSLLFVTASSLIGAKSQGVVEKTPTPSYYSKAHQKFIRSQEKEGFSFPKHPQVLIIKDKYYYIAEKTTGDKTSYYLIQIEKRLRTDVTKANTYAVPDEKGTMSVVRRIYNRMTSARAVAVPDEVASKIPKIDLK